MQALRVPLLVLPLIAALAAPAHTQAVQIGDVEFGRYSVAVDGETAHGWLAYPTDADPEVLVVMAHGCCIAIGSWSSTSSSIPMGSAYNMVQYAQAYDAAVVAMDYRGEGHWDVWKGHRDLLAATRDLQDNRSWDIQRTILYGLSMGGEVSGMAAAAEPDLFDAWVAVFGVFDLYEEFAVLGHLGMTDGEPAPELQSWIVEEAGGLPDGANDPDWDIRSPARRAGEMAGLPHAYLFHAPGDTYVPLDQSVRMFKALVDAGVPASLWVYGSGMTGTATTCLPGSSLKAACPEDHDWEKPFDLGGLGVATVPAVNLVCGIQGPLLPVAGQTCVPTAGSGPSGHDYRVIKHAHDRALAKLVQGIAVDGDGWTLHLRDDHAQAAADLLPVLGTSHVQVDLTDEDVPAP